MFEKLLSFTKKVADLSDRPAMNSAALKAHFDAAPDEVRVYYNKLIDALQKTTAGDSGAKNIGATGITGLTGSDVQALLESLNTVKAKKDQEPYQDLPLANNWVYYGTGSKPQYYKNEVGEVFVKGLIKGGSSNGRIAVAVLPVGCRPAETKSFYGWDGVNSIKRIDVESNGFIVIPSGWSVNNTYLTIDLPPFRAEQ